MGVFLKSAFCIWACLFLVLPGCICQVLGPLGITLPGHDEGSRVVASENTVPQAQSPLALKNAPACHCDERPDREADDRVLSDSELFTGLELQWESGLSYPEAPFPLIVRQIGLPSRAPPAGSADAATKRHLLCALLL